MSEITDEMVELRHKAIAAAWSAWHSRHGGKLGPGVAFTEAIDAVLGVISPAHIERVREMEAALDEIETRTRQALIDAAHTYRADKPVSSAMFKAEIIVSNTISNFRAALLPKTMEDGDV